MQTLSLNPTDTEPTKASQATEAPQTREYDYSRDTSAQPSNAWFDHDQAYYESYCYATDYYDPYGHQYGYGTYAEGESHGAEYSLPEQAQESNDENADTEDADDGGVDLSAGLCSQYLASGQCSKGSRCRLVHGDLCKVRLPLQPTT